MTAKKPKQEIRVICAKFGERGHSAHAWGKGTMAKAKQSVIDLDHLRENGPATHFYRGETPYSIQVREVGPWEDEA